MSVDVLGRQLIREKDIYRGPSGIGFVLTKDADFNIESKRLCNVGISTNFAGAVNFGILNSTEWKWLHEIEKLQQALNQLEIKIYTLKSELKLKKDLILKEKPQI